MLSKLIKGSILVIFAAASVSNANFEPRDEHGIGTWNPEDQFGLCDNPYDPNCVPDYNPGRPNNPYEPGRPNRPPQPGRPNNPNNPHYPGRPNNPGYPSNPGYGSQQINLNIYRNTFANDRIDLTRYFNVERYRGYRISEVIVTASPRYNVALADLLINGWSQGTYQFDHSGYSTSLSLRLRNRPQIGYDAASIVLSTRGNMTVERVTLVISR